MLKPSALLPPLALALQLTMIRLFAPQQAPARGPDAV
jgi:hypothetical protein